MFDWGPIQMLHFQIGWRDHLNLQVNNIKHIGLNEMDQTHKMLVIRIWAKLSTAD